MNLSDAQIVVGKIVAVAGAFVLPDGTTGYTTASVSYTILQTTPVGGVIEWPGQVPEIRLWGNDQVIDAPSLIGRSCIGVVVGGELRWHFPEPAALGGCPTSVGGNGQQSPLVRGLSFDPTEPPPPPPGGTATGPGAGGTSGTGTGGIGEN